MIKHPSDRAERRRVKTKKRKSREDDDVEVPAREAKGELGE